MCVFDGYIVYWLLMHCFLQEMCVQYWPETVGQSEVYGTFQVEVCGNERVLGEYIVRKLKLSPVDMVSSFMSTVICCFMYLTFCFHHLTLIILLALLALLLLLLLMLSSFFFLFLFLFLFFCLLFFLFIVLSSLLLLL